MPWMSDICVDCEKYRSVAQESRLAANMDWLPMKEPWKFKHQLRYCCPRSQIPSSNKFDIFNLMAYHVYKIPQLDSPFVVLSHPGILILPVCIQSLSRARKVSGLITQVESDEFFLSWQQYSRNVEAYLPREVPLTEVGGSKIGKTLCLTTFIEHIDNLRCKRMLGSHVK